MAVDWEFYICLFFSFLFESLPPQKCQWIVNIYVFIPLCVFVHPYHVASILYRSVYYCGCHMSRRAIGTLCVS